MKQKRRIPWGSMACLGLASLAGAVLGYGLMDLADRLGGGQPLGFISYALGLLAAAVLAYCLQVVVHEGGHLVCGLLTGYRLLSFRVGHVTLARRDGRWRLCAYHIPGTGGQCLMEPPARENPPYRLYHLGGGLANLLAALAALPALVMDTPPLPRFFSGAMAAFGIGMAAVNLIPMKAGEVANDGYNARNLGHDPAALRCLSVQLWMSASLLEGRSLADMPEEWFALPKNADLNNPMIAGTAIQGVSRLLARGEVEEADRAIQTLLQGGYDLLGFYRLELTGEAIYCALVLGRAQQARRLYTPEVRRYWKQTLQYFPGRVRQAYAWALLAEGDRAQGETLRKRFERTAARYPYTGELPGERALLDRVDQVLRASSPEPGREQLSREDS